uniref:Peptidase M12B domain-containing protein n=1 Tax=Plectus sambesii TaxID=2011161 RepID=A0A914VTU3_9BILA
MGDLLTSNLPQKDADFHSAHVGPTNNAGFRPGTSRGDGHSAGAANIGGNSFEVSAASDVVLKAGVITVDVIVTPAKPHVAQADKIIMTEDSLRRKRSVHNRVRRAVHPQVYLELGVIVDKGLWDTYVTNYGSQAQAELDSYIGAVIDMLQSDYLQFSPPVHIEVQNYTVWKVQPTYTTAGKYNGDIDTYLADTRLSPYNANAMGVDHVTIVSGFNLQKGGGPIGGLAYTDVICSPTYSVSVMNGGDFTTGYILAHELGHSFGILHDGDASGTYEKSCSGVGFLMSPSTGTQGPGWSTCSKARYQATIDKLDSTNTNCLLNVVTPDAVNANPGQKYPMESQCIGKMGACGRAAIPTQDNPTDCRAIKCRSHMQMLTSSNSVTKLDGTFCGSGKTCQNGVCATASITLTPVNGGWGAWSERADSQCGGNGCSKACVMVGQKRLQVQNRRCDSPFPNNGGTTCAGRSQRAVVCGATCTTGVATRAAADLNKCKVDNPTATAATPQSAPYDCLLVCATPSGTRYTNAENGVPCTGGFCLNGECATKYWSAGSLEGYGYSTADFSPAPVFNGVTATTTTTAAPAGPPTNCVYQWSAFSACSASCGTGLKSQSRSPLQQATNGGTPCETTPSYQFATCKLASCPGATEYTYNFVGVRVDMTEVTASSYGTTALSTQANWNACANACTGTGQCKAILWDDASKKCVVFTVLNQSNGVRQSSTSPFVLYLL